MTRCLRPLGVDLVRLGERLAPQRPDEQVMLRALGGSFAVRACTDDGADPWRTPLPPWGMRLYRLLRDVRRALDPGDRQITWADDGRVCRLVGAAARMQR